MLKWKKTTAVFVLFVTLCTAGCQQSGGNEGKTKPAREEIVLWSYYETDVQKTALDELMEGFNESQDTYNIRWEYHGPVTEFNKKLAIGITQKQLPDIVILDNPDMRRYVEQGFFEDVTEAVQEFDKLDQYYPNVLSSVVYEGRYYGLPFCCNNTGLIYNKDMLSQKGITVPQTWEEMKAAAQSLTQGNTKGFAMSAIDGEQSAFQILPFILSAGDEVESLGGEGSVAAFALIRDLVESGAMSRDCVNWSQNDVAQKFIAGEAAMMENGPWVLPALEKAGINYGIARLPFLERYAGVAGGENMGVLKGKNVDGAVAFMEYYNQNDTMLGVSLRADSIPPREDLARLVLSVKPNYQIFFEQMPACISRSSFKEWPQVTALLSDAQFQVITGAASPEEVCEKIKNR